MPRRRPSPSRSSLSTCIAGGCLAFLAACHPAGKADSDDSASPDTGPAPAAVGCGALAVEPGELPDRVVFRTSTRSFNQDWYVALQEGRVWIRPNTEAGLEEGPWTLLGGTGLPSGGDLQNFGPPDAIAEISVDGVHLTALSADGHFYRGTDMTTDVRTSAVWSDGWGGAFASGPGIDLEFSTVCGWSVSDSHPFGVAWYEDPNGTEHSVGLGVAHVYRLGEDGRSLHFNDWWLPPDWSRQVCLPDRGTFQAVNLSVSASTIFVVGSAGELYTRLYDCDTGGENPLLTYSYVVGPDSGTTRKLPSEDWFRQPDPPGRVTPRISIHQTGEGNAARTLRVEGEQDGVGGLFEKGIEDAAWTFQPSGEPVVGPFLDPASAADPPDPVQHAFHGTLTLDGTSFDVEVDDLHLVCSPSHLRLSWNGVPVTAGGSPLSLELHHVSTLVEETRPTDFREQGLPDRVQAAILVPDLSAVDDPDAREALRTLTGDRPVVDLLGDLSATGVTLSEIMWDEPFRVPAEEKGFWSPVTLSLVP